MLIRCEYTRLVPISELKENKENENLHTEDQIAQLAEILIYQGIRKPIIVSNQSGLMVTGHATRLACIKNGYTDLPVSFQDFIDEDQETAHRIADNAIAAQAILSMAKINLQIPKLSPDFNLKMMGFKNLVLDPSDLLGDSFNPSESISTDKEQKKCPHCGGLL